MDLKPPVNRNDSHIVRKAEQHAKVGTNRTPSDGDGAGTTADAKPPGWRDQVGCFECFESGRGRSGITTLYKTSTAGEATPRTLDRSLGKAIEATT